MTREVDMNHQSSGQSHEDSLSQLVEKACRHWEAKRQPGAVQRDLSSPASPAFTIALSREVGTQGTSVAKEVGRILGWHVYDHELLEHIAKEMGLRTALLSSVDERHQSWLLEAAEAFLSAPVKSDWGPLVTESAYVHHLVETVLALGIHGECVIVGRGAALILPVQTTLRVRLVGPVRARIAALGRKLGISEREAARQVRTMDRERTDFVQDHFLKDPTDPRNYDLVLNALRLPVAKSAELIVEMLYRLKAAGIAMNPGVPSS
jgi:cytidylate kinase